MGPQLGYYYPEIVQQIHLEGPGIKAQGVGVPGLAMYILIGRTQNYAWSLTSAGHDVRDVYAERLCNKNGTEAHAGVHALPLQGQVPGAEELQRRAARHGKALKYKVSVHGPIIGTATVGGRPYALSRKRSTFGRDGAEPGRAQGPDRGQGHHAEEVLARGQPVRIHVQLGLRLAQGHVELLVGPAAEARPRARPPPAHPGHRQVRVARLPLGAPAPARHRAVRADSC